MKAEKEAEANGQLSQIDEQPNEASADKGKDPSKFSEKLSEHVIRAERFDFTFNQRFIKHNLKVDKYGERV